MAHSLRSRVPAAIAVAIAVVVSLVLFLLLAQGRAGGVDLAQAAPPPPSSLAANPVRAAERPPQVARPDHSAEREGTTTLTVRDGAEVALRDSPGGAVVTTLTDTTEFDSPTVLSVRERRGRWAGVPTHELPNGKLGWVRVDPAALKVDSVGQRIVLDLSQMQARLFRGDDLERRWQIGIGAPDTPTPTGHFSITDEIVGGLDPTYGCCAIALSATQPHLPPGWTGGDRIAIHGTSLPLGEANSTGCPHSAEEDLRYLIDKVPLGTPVSIHP
jgi:hypothetical protein